MFTYIAEIRKLARKVNDLNSLVPESCQIKIPDNVIRALLLRAVRQVPMYKSVIDSLIIKKPSEWTEISTDTLYRHLEQVNANVRGLELQKASKMPTGEVLANAATVKADKDKKKSSSVCYDYAKNGVCNRPGCKWQHTGPISGAASTLPAQKNSQSSNSQAESKRKSHL